VVCFDSMITFEHTPEYPPHKLCLSPPSLGTYR
jgi:hypothetical protein